MDSGALSSRERRELLGSLFPCGDVCHPLGRPLLLVPDGEVEQHPKLLRQVVIPPSPERPPETGDVARVEVALHRPARPEEKSLHYRRKIPEQPLAYGCFETMLAAGEDLVRHDAP